MDIGNNSKVQEHTNRLSSFGLQHVCDIRGKGEVLSATSAWRFQRIERDPNFQPIMYGLTSI